LRRRITSRSVKRSDSVDFQFPSAYRGHGHPHHGTQVDNQVPLL
jgi:hypothetical protein